MLDDAQEERSNTDLIKGYDPAGEPRATVARRYYRVIYLLVTHNP